MKGGKLTFTLPYIKPAKEVTINALCIDSLDAIQTTKIQQIKRGVAYMQQSNWGKILDQFTELFIGDKAIFKMQIPIILIAHTLVIPPVYNQTKEGDPVLQTSGRRKWAVQGSLKDKLDRWFDYIIHVVKGGEIKAKEGNADLRIALVDPLYRDATHFGAGDRTGLLKALADKDTGGKMISLPEDEKNPGFPKIDIMAAIVAGHKW